MKYEAGNRFTPETYLKTEAESGTTVSLKVTGELEGVEVSFDSGDAPELTTLSATENTTYNAPEGTAYNEVTVNVPNTYTAEDAGKVVVEGALVSQTSTTKTANGTYNTTTNNEVVIEVPNTYTAADEGKVVDQGALVAQTSTTKTANGTYDTTLNNEVVINVSSGTSNWTLLHQEDITVQTTGSSALAATLDVPNISTAELVFVKIRDKAGTRNGYFYGSDNYMWNNTASIGSWLENFAKQIYRLSSDGTKIVGTGSNGVYARSVHNGTNQIQIYSAYNSTTSGTVDGTFSVEVYKLTYADGSSSPFPVTP